MIQILITDADNNWRISHIINALLCRLIVKGGSLGLFKPWNHEMLNKNNQKRHHPIRFSSSRRIKMHFQPGFCYWPTRETYSIVQDLVAGFPWKWLAMMEMAWYDVDKVRQICGTSFNIKSEQIPVEARQTHPHTHTAFDNHNPAVSSTWLWRTTLCNNVCLFQCHIPDESVAPGALAMMFTTASCWWRTGTRQRPLTHQHTPFSWSLQQTIDRIQLITARIDHLLLTPLKRYVLVGHLDSNISTGVYPHPHKFLPRPHLLFFSLSLSRGPHPRSS